MAGDEATGMVQAVLHPLGTLASSAVALRAASTSSPDLHLAYCDGRPTTGVANSVASPAKAVGQLHLEGVQLLLLRE
eukprot:3348777-Prorocentrum_lima.AAC.1